MRLRSIVVLTAFVLASAVAGCSSEPEAPATPATPAGTPAAPADPGMPDATADAVWAHLQAANYQQAWQLWPGKDRMYAGGDPHGQFLTTYVNPVAHDALMKKASSMPRGAIVVKENHGSDKQLSAVSVMYKAQSGYNAGANDWFWLQRMANGEVKASGQVEMCESCHRSGTDYVRTAWPQ